MASTAALMVLAALATMVPWTEAYYKLNLTEGEQISNGQYLMVPDNSSLVPPWLAMQRDCNFVLYDQVGQPAWNTRTNGQGIAGSCYATVTQCNLLVFNGKGNKPAYVLWNSSTSGTMTGVIGISPCFATIELARITRYPNAVLFDSLHNVVWSSNGAHLA